VVHLPESALGAGGLGGLGGDLGVFVEAQRKVTIDKADIAFVSV